MLSEEFKKNAKAQRSKDAKGETTNESISILCDFADLCVFAFFRIALKKTSTPDRPRPPRAGSRAKPLSRGVRSAVDSGPRSGPCKCSRDRGRRRPRGA